MPFFSTKSVDEDVLDLYSLISKLEDKIILLGHSTGCQDIILFMKKYRSPKISQIILQAPVSDIEYQDELEIAQAQELIMKLKSDKKLYVEIDSNIWLKERYISLYEKYGKEDFFSTWIDKSIFFELKNLLPPTSSIISEKDEFCKHSIEDHLKILGDVFILKNADHSITSLNAQKEFLVILKRILFF